MHWYLIVAMAGAGEADWHPQPSLEACEASAAEVLADAPDAWPGETVEAWCLGIDPAMWVEWPEDHNQGAQFCVNGCGEGQGAAGAGPAANRPRNGGGRAIARDPRAKAGRPRRSRADAPREPEAMPDPWGGRWPLERVFHQLGLWVILAAGWCYAAWQLASMVEGILKPLGLMP